MRVKNYILAGLASICVSTSAFAESIEIIMGPTPDSFVQGVRSASIGSFIDGYKAMIKAPSTGNAFQRATNVRIALPELARPMVSECLHAARDAWARQEASRSGTNPLPNVYSIKVNGTISEADAQAKNIVATQILYCDLN